MSLTQGPQPWLKPAVLVGSLVPLFHLAYLALTGGLGANPVERVLNQLGLLALIFLIASLACSPLKARFGLTWPMRLRRMLGLFAFFYASLHLLSYVGLDQFFDWGALWEDVTQRKFMAVGFAAFVLLVPLAVTSTKGWIRKLGYARWQQLHRLAYPAALLAVVHFLWKVKKDLTEPLGYGILLALLLLVRVPQALARARRP